MSSAATSSGWADRIAASDRVVLALLFTITAVFAVRAPSAATAATATARHGLLLHAGLLVAFAAIVAAMAASAGRSWASAVPWVRAIATIGVLLFLYESLGKPVFSIIPWRADASLARIDEVLFFGHSPALWASRHIGVRGLELWSAIYGFFIPFLYLSILSGCVGRPARERDRFLFGFAVTYSIAYLGYLLLPSTGPIELFPSAAPPEGGPIHRMILSSVTATGGNHGAFPSLHVGASAYLCLFDWRHNLLRGMTYAPVVVLIGFSTLFLQYHYVVDLLAGLAIAWGADRLSARTP